MLKSIKRNILYPNYVIRRLSEQKIDIIFRHTIKASHKKTKIMVSVTPSQLRLDFLLGLPLCLLAALLDVKFVNLYGHQLPVAVLKHQVVQIGLGSIL